MTNPGEGGRTTFALVPGAGMDRGVWRWTVAELEARDRHGLAPRLPLEHPDAGPSAHADAVLRAVSPRPGPLVIVGQSLGAYAASLVAARTEVTGLVLLAPMIPAPGESAGEWWTAVNHAEAIAPLTQRLGPMSAWESEQLAEVFLHDVPAEVVAASERFVGRPGPGMFREPWPLRAWPEVPTCVLAPREDRLFPLAFQRRIAQERLGLEVEEISGGHVPMLARPAELAEHLIAIEQRWRAPSACL